MDKRTGKQLIVVLIFVGFLALIGTGIFFLFFRVTPTCNDGIKNGKEEGIDCGVLACGKTCEAPVQPLKVVKFEVLKIGEGDYDFAAQILNPNTNYGSGDIEYQLISGSSVLANGSTYILPGQTKYLIIPSVASQTDNMQLEIKSVKWGQIEIAKEPIDFTVRDKNFSSPNNSSQVEGNIYNGSNYDFDNIDVAVVLFDESGSIVGVNKTIVKTFVAKTSRYFKVQWPGQLNDVSRVDVEANTNLYSNSNYIKSHGSQNEFQTYY